MLGSSHSVLLVLFFFDSVIKDVLSALLHLIGYLKSACHHMDRHFCVMLISFLLVVFDKICFDALLRNIIGGGR